MHKHLVTTDPHVAVLILHPALFYLYRVTGFSGLGTHFHVWEPIQRLRLFLGGSPMWKVACERFLAYHAMYLTMSKNLAMSNRSLSVENSTLNCTMAGAGCWPLGKLVHVQQFGICPCSGTLC